ncbi:hypothetical protein, partial [Blastomonas sp. AAP25]
TPPAPVPAPAAPAATPGPVANGSAPATSTPPAHWSRGAISGAGRLISTAANDEMVRSLISSRAKSNLAAGFFGGTLMGAIAARIATRSVPGALLVGGALLAKAIYDQRKAKEEAELNSKPKG